MDDKQMHNMLSRERETAVERKLELERELTGVKERISALDTLLKQNSFANLSGKKTGNNTVLGEQEASASEKIKSVINSFSESFSIPDIEAKLTAENVKISPNTIQSAVRRLRNQGIIRTVRKGKGRRAATYRRIK